MPTSILSIYDNREAFVTIFYHLFQLSAEKTAELFTRIIGKISAFTVLQYINDSTFASGVVNYFTKLSHPYLCSAVTCSPSKIEGDCPKTIAT